MEKNILFFIVILLLINSAFATQLRINPSHITLNGSVNENICGKVNITTDYNGNIIGEIKWSKEDTKKLMDYSLDMTGSNKFEFPENIKINKSKEISFCLNSKDPGEFYGALLYHTENSPAGVGIWINANIIGESGTNNDQNSKITGMAIDSGDEKQSFDLKIILYFLPTLFLFVLFMLLLFYRKRVVR